MKPNVLMDIDGVLADFYVVFARFLNANFNTTLDPTCEPPEYSFSGWGGGTEGLDPQKVFDKFSLIGGYLSLDLFPGADKFFNEVGKKANIWVVTSRDDELLNHGPVSDKVRDDTVKWLKQYNLNPYALAFRYNKVSFCLDNNIDLLIEDKLDTALQAAKKGLNTILIDRGWNQADKAFRVYRAKNYDTALRTLENLL